MKKDTQSLNAMIRAIDVTCGRAEKKEGALAFVTLKATHLRHLLDVNKQMLAALKTIDESERATDALLSAGLEDEVQMIIAAIATVEEN